MNDIIKLKISDTEYLKVSPIPDACSEKCNCSKEVNIYYVNTEKHIEILCGIEYEKSFYFFLSRHDLLPKLIKGEMVADKDLGIEWNKYFEMTIEGSDADSYECFSVNSNESLQPFNSFMYNDKEGAIIFEVSPFYHWSSDQKEDPGFISFEEFLKEYKPAVKTKISKENLEQWIQQANTKESKYGK